MVTSSIRNAPGRRKKQELVFTEGEMVKNIHTLWDSTLLCTRRTFWSLLSELTGTASVEQVKISDQTTRALLKLWILSRPNLNCLSKVTRLSTNRREQVRSPCYECLVIWASEAMRCWTVWSVKQAESNVLVPNP